MSGTEPSPRGEFLPLTSAQLGMWFAESMSPDYSVNVAHYLDIVDHDRPLDAALLTRIHDEGARELESAFTRLVEVDGVPMQTIDLSLPFTLESMDLRSEPDPVAAAHDWMNDDYRRGVDLLAGEPLARAVLIRVADDRHFWYLRGHHLIMDGYAALNALLRGVDGYNAAVAGEPYVEKPRASLAELVADDVAYSTSTRRERDREYWAARVVDLPERVSLAEHAVTAPLSPVNIVAGQPLAPDMQARLTELAADLGISLAVLLTTGFSAYLARMTGTDEVVLSVPVTGRASAKIKRGSGMVSNMLPVRSTDAAHLSLRDLAAQTQLEMTGVLRHQRYRFEDIRIDAGLRDANTASFGPVVNMVFFERAIEITGTRVAYKILASGILEDLRINFYQASPSAPIVIDLHGNEHLYSHDEVAAHVDRFLTFLDRLAEAPDRRIGEIDLLTDTDRDAVAVLERGEDRDYRLGDDEFGPNLLDGFEQSVRAVPDAIAFIDGDAEITYADFDGRRRGLAARLRARGVRPGDRVVVSLQRGIDQLAAVYAVLTVGAAYVPVSPDDPQDRRDRVVAVAGTDEIIDAAFLATARQVPGADARGPDEHDRFEPIRVPADAAAYVLFTSGSTGTPKGVAVSHRAICNRLAWMQEHYPLAHVDRVLYKTPITFDVSVWELFWPQAIGATTVIARPDGHRDPHYLHRLVAEHAVSVLHFVPSMLDVFVDARAARPAGEPLFPASVSRIFASGESLGGPLADNTLVDGTVDLVNLYGPTEAAVDITEHRVRVGEVMPPIGTPVPNSDVYVLDDRLRRVPVGAPGELYLAGVQLATGYIGSAGLTAGRFIADPNGGGTRMYRTGDLVRWTRTGELDYLGRTDFQVKIRGQRVELGEVEAVLARHDDVDIAVAVVRDDIAETPTLVAYVRIAGTSTTETELVSWCRRRLPSHMVPTAVVILDEFPVGGAGKLDRRQLPAPALRTAEYVAPESEVEVALASLIAEMVGAPRVGLRDNLFAIGGDSLVAARLVTRARDRLGFDVQLNHVFEAADIGELAGTVQVGSVDGPAIPPITHVADRPAAIPASLAQARLWTVNQMDPSAGTYNMPGAVRLPSDVDLAALRQALIDVIERHETLRSTYAQDGDHVFQVVRDVDDALGGIDVEPQRSDDVDAEILRFASRGFDLGTQTPVRARLLTDEDGPVLVLVMHHIAADGFSLVPLIRDLLTAYTARATQRVPNFAPLELEYADFALWQRDLQDDAVALGEAIDFWRRELSGLPDVLVLPTDRPRPPVASGRGAHVEFTVKPDLVRKMTARSRQLGVTPFTMLHGALATVLSGLSGTDDIAIGTAVGGREDERLSALVGMFVDTVVLRTRVGQGTTLGDFLADAHRIRAQAMAHSVVPFDRVVAEVSPTRSASYAPLFQVGLTMITDTTKTLRSSSGFEVIDVRIPSAKYDLAVSAIERDDHYTVEISYATDLFDAATADAFGDFLHHVLEQFATRDLDEPIAHVDLVSDAEIAVLTKRPDSAAAPEILGSLWDGHGRSQPGAIADGADEWSRAEFDGATHAVARALIARGIGTGDVVAIGLGRSLRAVVAMVAISRTGAAFLSIDPSLPDDRRSAVLSDSDARIGLTDAVSRPEAPEVPEATEAVEWLLIDDLLDGDRTPVGSEDLVSSVSLDDIAYLIYTSGSTGAPKATAVSHRGLANMIANQRTILDVDESSRVLQVAAPSFDASIFEITMALGNGAALVISPSDVFAGEELATLIAARRVTHIVMTPSAMTGLRPDALPHLATVCSVGEACPPELMRRWASAGRSFFNLYGPTEATIWATAAGPLTVTDPITIGPAVPGVSAYVLGDDLRPVPAGVPGELYLAGEQVALGYLGRVDLTAARFVADPFAAGHRMYRTGDRVVRDRCGALEYLGRTDFQIKIRGMRVEPGEIDATLATHPGVAAALTVGVIGPNGDTVLVSYVTPSAAQLPDADQVRAHAAARLPGHMVPHTVMPVERFAVNAVGKIDRTVLPEPVLRVSGTYREPSTAAETLVADVMGQVLHVERVGVDDDFFSIGGNSLSATTLATMLASTSGRDVAVRDVFTAPTVAELARLLETTSDARSRPSLVRYPRPQVPPLTEVQRGMWLINRAAPESSAYNIAVALRLSGTVEIDAVRDAVRDLLERQESLRTVYPPVNGEPTWRVIALDDVPAAVTTGPTPVSADDLPAAISDLTGRGFDVTADIPIRVGILELAPTEHIIVIVLHHIAGDGASMKPLAEDFLTALTARAEGEAPTFPPLSIEYRDFALWQQDMLDADAEGRTERERQIDYWKQRLLGAPELLALPTDRGRPSTPSYEGAEVRFEIPAETVGALEHLGRRQGGTLFTVMHTAFAIFLSRMAGSRDVVVGIPYAGRAEPSLAPIVGMFVNSLALRTQFRDGESVAAMIARVARDDVDDLAHADIAFESVAQAVGQRRSRAYNPVFQTMLWFQNLEFPGIEIDGLTVTAVDEQLVSAKVDLQLSLFPNDPALMGAAETNTPMRAGFIYSVDLFDPETIATYASRFLAVLDSLVSDPNQQVSDVSIASEDERRTLDTAAPVSAVPLSQLIQEMAAEAPETVAYRFDSADYQVGAVAEVFEAMVAVLPDPDSALVTGLMTLSPTLANAGPEALDELLSQMRERLSSPIRG